ncbi:DUF1775 domain-containing protein [Pseudovibrio sp. Ad26]|uniref:YcnI family copper-binding membrane protein n=1 Tax=Pseudovibrio sp. Ad26 TaxID=989410 RepID=UPI0007AECBC3|nr:DUF1775 domain-containing protein [Pseudovibrio sp. Ad26]KZL13160.1 hypothetical protein PsAD26_01930 [Pseudovibrio sp. Ad26]
MKKLALSMLSFSMVIAASSAYGHATLEQKEAEVGSTYKGVIRIGHGCDGQPTLKVRVVIPEGVVSVKPMLKAGWELETETGPYAKTYEYYGKTLSEGVKQITWTGSLKHEHYDEFIFRAKLHKTLAPEQTLYFKTTQECGSGENAWIEIPADGQNSHDLKRPAPGVHLIKPSEHSH